MFGESLVPPKRPNLAPLSVKRCSKCQDFGHTSLVCPNKEFITLTEWETTMEEENEDKSDHKLEETQEEIIEETREEELLSLKGVLSQQKGVQHEPSNPSPTHPQAKTINLNFCQSISERLLKALNSELRVFEEMVRSMFTNTPTFTIQIRKGTEKKRVSKFRGDLFSRLILFQPELKEEEDVIA